MSHPHSRSSVRAAAGAATFVLAAVLVAAGCTRKAGTGAGPKPSGPAGDAAANALGALESEPDLTHCRTALNQLDSQEGAASRPTLSEAEAAELASLFTLSPPEAKEIAQAGFAPTDAAYLEQCLLVRSGVRSLRVDDRPALDRARIGFDWVCRLVYLDDRISWPANPWSTLEGGPGIALSRAYAVLAAWQQLGLDGCLVGPPALKTTPAQAPNPADRSGRPTYAPVRMCGVLVDGQVYLFDPATRVASPESPPTLAAVREKPDALTGFAADEVKSWQPFLAPPLSGLSRRMEWLQQRNPGAVGVKLFVDAHAARQTFGGCDAWNPEGDPFTATRVLGRYAAEEGGERSGPLLRQRHLLALLPLESLPKTDLAITFLLPAFARPFDALRWGPNTPRDWLVRGEFVQAMSALEDTRKMVDNAAARMENDKSLQRDFEEWAKQFQSLTAKALRSDPNNPAAAQQALEQFRRAPHSQDIERAFVLGHAARPLGAEVAFLTAQCVHERAERARIENSPDAPAMWTNAADWWQRFLDASARANSPFPAREPHARALLARAQQFAGK